MIKRSVVIFLLTSRVRTGQDLEQHSLDGINESRELATDGDSGDLP